MNIGAQIGIGLFLILGAFTRVASVAGIAFLLLYYVANPPLVGYEFGSQGDGSYLVVDLRLIEALGLAVLAALPVAALYGLDRWYAASGPPRRRPGRGAPGRRSRAPGPPARTGGSSWPTWPASPSSAPSATRCSRSASGRAGRRRTWWTR